MELKKQVDVCVVGAGHAGCEAALACARLGLKTVIFTVSVDSIALMPCNPNIGGSSKGHLVKEVDALGGEMGKVIDRTFIQSKMLNSSKGPAVHSLRAQADKANYSKTMRKVLEDQENLEIKQMEVTEILAEDGADGKKIITGVRTYSGATYRCRAVVLCTGTYLKARCIYGDVSMQTGPNGLQPANYLTDSLKELGIEMLEYINEDGVIEIPAARPFEGNAAASNTVMPAMDERAASSAAPAYITQWQQYFPQEKELVSIQNMYVNTEEGYYFLMPSSWLETVTGALEAGERQFIFSEWVVNDEGVGASGAVILKIGVFTKANWDAHITATREFTSVLETEDTVYAVSIPESGGDKAISYQDAAKRFGLIESDNLTN